MKNAFITSVFCMIVAGFYCDATLAQNVPVKVEFFVNDRPTTKKVRIIFSAYGINTEPSVSDDGTFLMPVFNTEWVDVRLISGKHDLLYSHIYLKKLYGNPTFRSFTSEKWLRRLTEREDLGCRLGQKWLSSYDLDYHDGTKVTVTNCAGQALVMPNPNPN